MVKVFLTGITGYIGGDTFYALEKAHPEFDYTVLVRDESKAKLVKERYPNANVRIVCGTLDDAQLLEEEAAKTDILIHTADASDHEGAARAFARGLAAGHTADRPGYWLHTSGTGILTWRDTREERYGEPPSAPPYDDLDGVDALTAGLPDDAFHRGVDKLVLAAGAKEEEGGGGRGAVRTAVVCPPTIYGPGRGPGNDRSRQAYVLVDTTLRRGKALRVGRGLSEWDHVHIHDLADLFVKLVEAAVARKPEVDEHIWGAKEGYFLAEGGAHVWGEVARWVAEAASQKGYLKEPAVEELPVSEAKQIAGFEAVSWGLNSRGHAKRARKYLGWIPNGRSLKDEIPYIVDVEAERLGIKPQHK